MSLLRLTLLLLAFHELDCFSAPPGKPHSRRHGSFYTLVPTALHSSTQQQQPPQEQQQQQQKNKKKHTVVFQKVVRSPPGSSTPTPIVGHLLEYLQERWTVPDRLPMVYEAVPVNDDPQGTVLSIDSSLSPDPAATQLRVQVVAILVDDDNDTSATGGGRAGSSSSSLAMVVVQKESTPSATSIPPMLKNLFADSESQILKALERGLEDLSAGKIRGLLADLDDDDITTTTTRLLQDKQAVLQDFFDDYELPEEGKELLQQQENSQNNHDSDDSGVIDAEIVPEESAAVETTTTKSIGEQRQAAMETMQNKSDDKPVVTPPPSSDDDQDFAVKAAKLAQAKHQKQKDRGAGDFAVQAALKKKKSLESKKKAKATTPSATAKRDSNSNNNDKKPVSKNVMEDPYSAQPLPILGDEASGNRFMATISSPEDYAKRKKSPSRILNNRKTVGSQRSNIKKQKSSNKVAPSTKASVQDSSVVEPKSSGTKVAATKESVQDATILQSSSSSKGSKKVASTTPTSVQDATIIEPKTVPKSPKPPTVESTPQRKINLRTMEEREPKMEPAPFGGDPVEDEKIQSTQDALDEMISNSKDMTPEELLQDVMKFGEQEQRENAPGAGFVNEALETAKTILRTQRAKREEQQRENVKTVETLTPDEELRRMFAAGEQLADSRMTTTTAQPSPPMVESPEDKKIVDDLIAADTSISSHARVLDDELAELEMRINPTPGEENDGPPKNPIFDIFSGPEVYDRNVDPETAVNWPGAMPGTKQVRLPKELDEAKQQANFAAHVIMHMNTTELPGGGNEYSFGGKTLSEAQVATFRKVVEDAVELRIIDDPVQILAEESRLQMLLDELWNQPDERIHSIASEYKDLMLSDHFVFHVKKRLSDMAKRYFAAKGEDETLATHQKRERQLLGHLVSYAQLLLKQARALGAEMEAQQLEVIRSICKVAMDPHHRTEEETAEALTDAVRDMRPLFDDSFVAYLKYAVAEEEARLARAGVLDDPDESRWLMVLQIVQKGVYAELAKGINRYLEHIWYVLRMETPTERRMLLKELIDVMPTLDVRPFVRVVENIAGALGESVRGEFDEAVPLGEMTNNILQLYRDTKELLPPERIAEKSRDADEWAARQKQKLVDQRKLTKQRLKAAADTEHLDEKIESMGRQAEYDRFD